MEVNKASKPPSSDDPWVMEIMKLALLPKYQQK